jgi:hypothetical protein
MAFRHGLNKLRVPLPRNCLKTVRNSASSRRFYRFAMGSGIYSPCQLFSAFVSRLSYIRKINYRVDSKRYLNRQYFPPEGSTSR